MTASNSSRSAGFQKGITYSDLMLGVSVLRNDRLAHVFYRLRLIEAFGTGIPRLWSATVAKRHSRL
jgi:ATP-dependent DNA helicase RecG